MKPSKRQKITILFVVLVSCNPIWSQWKYSAQGLFIGGKIIPHSKNLRAMELGTVMGGELAFEWLPNGENQWQQFWNFPTVGMGLGMISFGNRDILGSAIYTYPYVKIPLWRNRFFDFNLKFGLGLSLHTKVWADADTLHGFHVATANSAISFPVNAYLTGSADFDIFITPQIAVIADIGYSHMSNGSFKNPNYGLNLINAKLGAKYYFVENNPHLVKNPAYGLPFDFEGKIILSGFAKEASFYEKKSFFVGSLHLGMTAPLGNIYAIGGGFDMFYDGAFIQRPSKEDPLYQRYKIDENKFANKLRVGIGLNNEFIMGRVTALLDWGIYLYDPIKNAYPQDIPKRGMFYKYNIDTSDGWNYFRLGARYRFFDNIVAQISVKTHLSVAEMVEFSIGYLFPFARPQHSSLSKSIKSYYLYHYDQKEATAFPTIW